MWTCAITGISAGPCAHNCRPTWNPYQSVWICTKQYWIISNRWTIVCFAGKFNILGGFCWCFETQIDEDWFVVVMRKCIIRAVVNTLLEAESPLKPTSHNTKEEQQLPKHDRLHVFYARSEFMNQYGFTILIWYSHNFLCSVTMLTPIGRKVSLYICPC